jgi:hypothetical protein
MGTLLALLLLQTTQAEIDAAVRKGLEVVQTAGQGELALWTMVLAEVPEASPAFQSLLKEALSTPLATTTSAALQAMILEELERRTYLDRITHAAQQLIDTQCRDGFWDAGRSVELFQVFPRIPPPPPAPRAINPPARPKPAVVWKRPLQRRAEGGEKGDPVHARWALWGLLAAHEAGVTAPEEVVAKAAAAWRNGEHDPADVVSALSICQYLRGRNWKKDPEVLKAVDRLAKEKRTEPRALYGLKLAMLHFGSDTLGGEKWGTRDAKILLAAQKPDGSWGDVEATCYATLALHSQARR